MAKFKPRTRATPHDEETDRQRFQCKLVRLGELLIALKKIDTMVRQAVQDDVLDARDQQSMLNDLDEVQTSVLQSFYNVI